MDRSQYIGCSEIGAILGLGPMSEYELWARKVGLVGPSANHYTFPGRLYENVILQAYQDLYPEVHLDRSLANYKADGLMHPRAPLGGHPDTLVHLDEKGGAAGVLDAKFYLARGLSGDRTVPAYAVWQLRGYMALLDVDYGQLACCWRVEECGDHVTGVDLEVVLVERERAGPNGESELIDLIGEWWERHVVGGIPPVLTARAIGVNKRREMIPGAMASLPSEADQLIAQWAPLAEQRAELGRAARAIDRDIKLIEERLRHFLGPCEAGTTPSGVVVTRRKTARQDRLVIGAPI